MFSFVESFAVLLEALSLVLSSLLKPSRYLSNLLFSVVSRIIAVKRRILNSSAVAIFLSISAYNELTLVKPPFKRFYYRGMNAIGQVLSPKLGSKRTSATKRGLTGADRSKGGCVA